MPIRPKRAADAAAVARLVLAVHRGDGYPRYLPDDLDHFMTSPCEVASWVAEVDGRIVGHVALHRADGDPTLPVAVRASGRRAHELVVLARLVVSPDARGQGWGRALIDVAADTAQSAGQRLVLDVVQDAPAVSFYDKLGWTRVAPLRLQLDRARSLDLWVYLGPDVGNPSSVAGSPLAPPRSTAAE